MRELRRRGDAALLRRLRPAARAAGALAVALLAGGHRGPDARGLAAVAHAAGAALQARLPDRGVPRRAARALPAAGAAVPGAVGGCSSCWRAGSQPKGFAVLQFDGDQGHRMHGGDRREGQELPERASRPGRRPSSARRGSATTPTTTGRRSAGSGRRSPSACRKVVADWLTGGHELPRSVPAQRAARDVPVPAAAGRGHDAHVLAAAALLRRAPAAVRAQPRLRVPRHRARARLVQAGGFRIPGLGLATCSCISPGTCSARCASFTARGGC